VHVLVRSGILALAGSVGAVIVTAGAGAAEPNIEQVALTKREDTSVAWVVDDADDDDLAGTRGDTNSRSRVSNDSTNSRHTAVSRDRDRSRGDKTKDWTRDGGDRTRDFSHNLTNDGSRNDTRGRLR